MSDHHDLRTRLARVLYDLYGPQFGDRTWDDEPLRGDYLRAAGVLIRELKSAPPPDFT